MEITQKVKDQAIALLAQGATLPAQLDTFPGMYVATHEDKTIHALGSVDHNGLYYKIGVEKTANVQR